MKAIAIKNHLNKSLKAQETFTLCEVTFNTYGGSVIAAQKVRDGEKIAKPSDPTRNSDILVTGVMEAASLI